jgi:poly(hydroxyalkanoate) granule-associated protein
LQRADDALTQQDGEYPMTEAAKTAETVQTAAAHGVDVARKIWLAGVGAYGRVFQEAQGQIGKVTGAANELFDELVAKGEQVEDMVRDSLKKNETAAKATEFVEKTTEQVKDYREKRMADLEERFETVRKTVMDTVAPFNVFGLGAQIQELTAKVEALTAEVESLKGAKPAAPKAKKAAAETEAA